jgi:hypothetical protein
MKEKLVKSTSYLLEISFKISKGKRSFKKKKKRWPQKAQLSRILSKKLRPSPLLQHEKRGKSAKERMKKCRED